MLLSLLLHHCSIPLLFNATPYPYSTALLSLVPCAATLCRYSECESVLLLWSITVCRYPVPLLHPFPRVEAVAAAAAGARAVAWVFGFGAGALSLTIHLGSGSPAGQPSQGVAGPRSFAPPPPFSWKLSQAWGFAHTLAPEVLENCISPL